MFFSADVFHPTAPTVLEGRQNKAAKQIVVASAKRAPKPYLRFTAS